MIQPAASLYDEHEAVTQPVVAPVSFPPLEALSPVPPANDAVKRRVWPWFVAGGAGVFLLALSLTFTVGFVTSAEEIDAALNALGVVAGAGFVGACGGAVAMWAFIHSRRSA